MFIFVGLEWFQLACCFSDMETRKKARVEQSEIYLYIS